MHVSPRTVTRAKIRGKAALSERSRRFRDDDISVQLKWRIRMNHLTRRGLHRKRLPGSHLSE
jgi:hypothetical protein